MDCGGKGMESNPYAAPKAAVDDVAGFAGDDLEARKASRGKRLGAALIDGLVSLVWIVPLVGGGLWRFDSALHGQGSTHVSGLLMFLGAVLALVVLVVNLLLIHRGGQTIGKRALDIAVVRSDGSPIAVARYVFLRSLPILLLALVPLVGRLAGLVDALVIFGGERRCLHDYIADSIVVDL